MIERPRRLRQNAGLRSLVAETRLHPRDLVLPVFVARGRRPSRVPIASMPGVVQHTLETSSQGGPRGCVAAGSGRDHALRRARSTRTPTGSGAVDPDGILNVALRAVRDAVGDDLVVMADTCLDEFTDHGHCGVLDDARPRRQRRHPRALRRDGRRAGRAGAHVVGP